MGVERENIILFGVKDEYNKFEDLSQFEKNLSSVRLKTPKECFKEGIFKIMDYMSGKYSYLGFIIQACGQDRWGEDVDLNVSLTLKELKNLNKEFKSFIKEHNIECDESKIGLYCFTHWT